MATQRISTKQLSGISLQAKCADCLHLCGKAHIELKKPCRDLGVKEYSRACEYYNPNIVRMSRSLGAMESVLEVISNMAESDLRLFALAVSAAPLIEKHSNFKFGQKVFFNLSSPYVEYVDSYYQGVVTAYVGRTAEDPKDHKGYLVIAGSLSSGTGTSIIMPIAELLTDKQWRKQLRQLINAGKFYTPRSNRLRFECGEEISPEEYHSYEVPSIDSHLVQSDTLKTKKKRSGGVKSQNKNLDTLHTEEYDDEDAEVKGNPLINSKAKMRSGVSVLTYDSDSADTAL